MKFIKTTHTIKTLEYVNSSNNIKCHKIHFLTHTTLPFTIQMSGCVLCWYIPDEQVIFHTQTFIELTLMLKTGARNSSFQLFSPLLFFHTLSCHSNTNFWALLGRYERDTVCISIYLHFEKWNKCKYKKKNVFLISIG